MRGCVLCGVACFLAFLAGCASEEAPPEARLLKPKEGKWIQLLETFHVENNEHAEIEAFVGKKRAHCFTLEDVTRSKDFKYRYELAALEGAATAGAEKAVEKAGKETLDWGPGKEDFKLHWHRGRVPEWVVNPRSTRPGSTFGMALEQEELESERGFPIARYLAMQPYVTTYKNAPWGVPNEEGYSVMRSEPFGWSLSRSRKEMTGFQQWSYHTRGCPTRSTSTTCTNHAEAKTISGVIDVLTCKNLCATMVGCATGLYSAGGGRCYLFGNMLDEDDAPGAASKYASECIVTEGVRTMTIFDCGDGECNDEEECPPGTTDAQCQAGYARADEDGDEDDARDSEDTNGCCVCGGGSWPNRERGAGSHLVTGRDAVLALWLGEGEWQETEDCPVGMFDEPPWAHRGTGALDSVPMSALEMGTIERRSGSMDSPDAVQAQQNFAEARAMEGA